MSREAVCGQCHGTGKVTVYEDWESVLNTNDQTVAFAEEQPDRWRVISLDVEDSYPTAVLASPRDRDETAVWRTLRHWAQRGSDDHPVSPRNIENGSFYKPVDPRFYETEDKQETP